MQHCLQVWSHVAVAATTASEHSAAETRATAPEAERQAVQRYVMPGKWRRPLRRQDEPSALRQPVRVSGPARHVVAAWLVVRVARSRRSRATMAAMPMAAKAVEQAVQHYLRTCVNVAVAAVMAARGSSTNAVPFLSRRFAAHH